MADTNAQADIRGMNVQKLAVGFAEEDIKLAGLINSSPTSAREIRWYQKTSGFLDSTDTTGITASQIANVDFKQLPVSVEQSWTRMTSYVRKLFVRSPVISEEDIKDSDIDILAGNLRDLVRSIQHQKDARIWDIISNFTSGVNTIGTINYTPATFAWDGDAASGVNIIKDIMTAKRKIRENAYDPEGGVLIVDAYHHQKILEYIINMKGSAIPTFSNEKMENGVVMGLLGLRVVVDQNATISPNATGAVGFSGCALVMAGKPATWKSFVPLTTAIVDHPGIGKEIRVWEEGECILQEPYSCCLIQNTKFY